MHLDHLRIQYFLELLMTQHRPGVVFIFLIETFDLVGPFFFFEQENLIYIPFGFL